ncbi:MAG: endonuclease MutS2 [Lachnospiraceae bacterium]|nr:endonuclease MutS2 [Lachnospiraceae bacterium]
MNEKVLRVVEFNKIIGFLEAEATSDPGRALCRNLLPMNDLREIERAQDETEAAAACLLRAGRISFGSNRDFTDLFRALAVESSLSVPELLRLASFLENVARVREYGATEENQDSVLYDLFDCLVPLPHLAREIRRCILSEEEIADDASAELRRIRRAMLATGDRIHSQLQKMVNVSLTSYLQDSVITIRDDRYCLPVRAEFKSQVPGIVHDQSASGSTVFIEPASIVALNNELRELALQEKKEIERILASLSAEAGASLVALRDNAQNMTSLDFIFARANLALSQNASRPVFNQEHRIIIRNGRHPLIDAKKVVPINLSLGTLPETAAEGGETEPVNMIIITGPNTGGKTVTLKTVGLLELMGMSGLHIPASDHSELSLFREVFADIGDEQSIEQSLSTFSSHMTAIVDIFRRCDRDCLCLFDELGAGTDPTEGAALAISILNFLQTRGIRTLATTHYAELKVYAMKTPGVQNASCEFNVETLQPTYRLLVGVPGRSNAFAISQKLGLPGYIIETARQQLSQDSQNFEEILSDLEEARRKAREEEESIRRKTLDLEKREKELKTREKQYEQRREEILRKANEQARDILQEAKDDADELIAQMRRSGRDADLSEMERTRSAIREKVSDKSSKLRKEPEKRSGRRLTAADVQVGDRVRVLSMGMNGVVESLPDKNGKLRVRIGNLNSTVRLQDLERSDEQRTPAQTGSGKSSLKQAFRTTPSRVLPQGSVSGGYRSVSPEINLIGLTVDEALLKLDKYLDDARMSHLDSVRVVHGKGTGALRNAVHQYLKKQHGLTFRSGDFGEGDAGVTIVTF